MQGFSDDGTTLATTTINATDDSSTDTTLMFS